MEEACFLARYASKVYIIHRFDYLEASKVMARRAMANPKVEVRDHRHVPKAVAVVTNNRLVGLITGLYVSSCSLAGRGVCSAVCEVQSARAAVPGIRLAVVLCA